eukprot:gnl/Chilomastix_caulleri/3495.p2 GENE.gnl/Chilomastix_caulleri/3495~~gnl/Chilomastix_caulleri/3495.p2  ORF type:complete len:66 (+),score=18.94 gnl/Chilomastix_caulleri/3495:263-460(+)
MFVAPDTPALPNPVNDDCPPYNPVPPKVVDVVFADDVPAEKGLEGNGGALKRLFDSLIAERVTGF